MIVGPKLFEVEHYMYQGAGIGGATDCAVYEVGDLACTKLQETTRGKHSWNREGVVRGGRVSSYDLD